MLTSLPNLLTLSRIGVLPVIVGLLYWTAPWASWIALAIFVVASVTDWLDGYFARLWNDVSPLGRFLDPIADKLLVAAVIVMLVASERIDGLVVLPALVILCREILVSGLREYLAEIRVPMPVSKLAKWKTALQMVALGILIVGEAGPVGVPLREIGEVGLWVAGGLTLVTGYDYLVRGLEHMRNESVKGAQKKA
jgi:cardiolipin synthase